MRAGEARTSRAGTPGERGSSAGPRGCAGVLVVGYGSVLRGDDALGWHAVARLARDPRLDGARVSWTHQLTPELADEIAGCSLLVLVDAAAGTVPGALQVRRLGSAGAGSAAGARGAAGAAGRPGAALTHHVAPESLLGLARELYGSAPEAWVVSVGAAGLDIGDGLSPAVEAALPAVIDAVAGIIGRRVHA